MSDNELDSFFNRSVIQMCTFRMAERLFGVDILDVVNLHETFGLEQKQKVDQVYSGKIVVFKQSVDEPFGILVDEVCDVVPIDPKRIVDRRSSGGETAEARELRRIRDEMVLGVYPLEKELLLLLNARRILGAGKKGLKQGEAA